MSDTSHRRGRPRRQKERHTLPTLAFRPSPDTRKLVEDGAKAARDSLSGEIDRRLRQAYWDTARQQAERERVFGGRHNFVLAFLLARVATGVEHECGTTWRQNRLVWREVATALVALLQVMRGLGGGTVELPVQVNGLPNPAWDVENVSREKSGPGRTHWHHILSMVDTILSHPMTLYWPLVDTLKKAHDDLRDDIIPRADELRELYANAAADPGATKD